MRSLVYLKAIVIVHGKSEKQICNWIKRKLRLKMEVVSEKNGTNSIQITSLMHTLNNKKFKTYKSFIKIFEDVELVEDGKSLSENYDSPELETVLTKARIPFQKKGDDRKGD